MAIAFRALRLLFMISLFFISLSLVTCSTILINEPNPTISEARADCQLDHEVDYEINLCMEDFFKASSIIPALSIIGYVLSILTMSPLIISIYRKVKKQNKNELCGR